MNNDDLVAEIEQFLAEGGEQPDGEALFAELLHRADDADEVAAWFETLTQEEQRILVATTEARMEEVRRILGPLGTAIMEFAVALAKAMEPFLEAFAEMARSIDHAIQKWRRLYRERCRRAALAHQLRRWRFPVGVAGWIANLWPQRWLPVLATPPP